MFDRILSPINYGGLILKNRIIFAPTTMGLPQEEWFQLLRRIAIGGCSLIIIGDVPAVRFSPELSLYDEFGFSYYCRVVEAAHTNNCKVCAQLYLTDSFFPTDCIIDSRQLKPMKNEDIAPFLLSLSDSYFKERASDFANAAQHAIAAGFDFIQILGDRMIGSICSSQFNLRQDRYGGNAANRARFACECVAAVRKRFPDLPIDYKLTVRQENPHYGNAGVLFEDLCTVVPLLEKAGVTSFHVTLANHSYLSDIIPSCRHPYFGSEGCFLKYCDEVRKYTSVPICGVGSLSSPDFIEAQLSSGRISCAAMSRQLIADPDWVNKVSHGDLDKIHQCIRCNGSCIQGMLSHAGVCCSRFSDL